MTALRRAFALSVAWAAAGAVAQPNSDVAPTTSTRCDLVNLEQSPPLRAAAQQGVIAAVGQASTCLDQRDASCADAALASSQALPLSDEERALLAIPRAEIASLRGDHAAAEKIYRDALALFAVDEGLHRDVIWRFAASLNARGEFAATLRFFDSIGCGRWTPESLALRGVAYQGLGARAFALENYEAALRHYELDGKPVPAAFKARYEELLAQEPPTVAAGVVYVPLVRINPDYPARALSRNLEGWVELEFDITDNGRTDDVRAISSMNEVFEPAAIAAVQRWRYLPKFDNGLPVRQTGVQTVISFCLDACNFRSTPPPRHPPESSSAPQ